MIYRSLGGASPDVDFKTATIQGQAPDKGLYFPTSIPRWERSFMDALKTMDRDEMAFRVMQPYVGECIPEATLRRIVHETLDFRIPLVPVTDKISSLELFHGPTLAFKDVGARFMSRCLGHFSSERSGRIVVLVATSGDTGGAVANGFFDVEGVDVVILYPSGKVSPVQEKQLTSLGRNIHALEVHGNFDDCQRMVKEAFVDAALRSRQQLSSANSINLGRLLPQAVYYAMTSLEWWRARHSKLSFIIPSGNLGNAVACIWARHMGLPIGDVLLAHNANQTVPDYLASGEWQPRSSRATLASAMDVGHPSNMERLRDLYPRIDSLRDAVTAVSIDDAAIEARVRADYARYGEIWCPHTAVGAEAWARLTPEARRSRNWCVVSTASPAKFPEIVEPLIGGKVPVPPSLAALLDRPSQFEEIGGTLDELRKALG